MEKRFPFYFIFLALAWCGAFSTAAAPMGFFARCSETVQRLLGKTLGKADKPTTSKTFKTFDELLGDFSKGLIPDLDDPSQRHAFEIYRKVRFGDPLFPHLRPSALADLAGLLKKYPELKKEPFLNFRVEFKGKGHPVTKEFSTFLNSQIKNAGQIRSNLFQVDANLGFWKKVLGYEGPMSALKNREEKRQHFMKFLEQRFPSPLRSLIAQKDVSFSLKARRLYRHLLRERQRLQNEEKDVRLISQLIVDLIHTAGYHQRELVGMIKNGDGMERLSAFRKILQVREELAGELGHANFEQVLKDLGVAGPSSLSGMDLWETLRFLENQMLRKGPGVDTHISKTIRHLSLVESPFRACLGGNDCSSKEYFSKALDPNYHYFTFTDERGHSSGQVTIVLGEAENKEREKVKVAFVDKLQNVANKDIPVLLEGVRQSVAEKGYRLAVPENGGINGFSGVSNQPKTRLFIETYLKRDWEEAFSDFYPHPNAYDFSLGHSRAHDKLPLRPLLPLTSSAWEMHATDLHLPWKVANLDLKALVLDSIALKRGGVEDKLRYIASMDAALKARLSPDPGFQSTLNLWLHNRSQSFKLRKRIFLYRWFEQKTTFSQQMLETFGPGERVVLIQNLWDTPRYKERLLNDGFVFALVAVRNNPKLRESLAQVYFPKHWEAISQVLQAEDIPDDELFHVLEKVKTGLDSRSIVELVGVAKLFRGSSLQEWMEDKFVQSFFNTTSTNAGFSKVFAEFNSSDAMTLRLVERVIDLVEDSSSKTFPALKTYSKLFHFKKETQITSLKDVAIAWLQKGDQRVVDLKAQFLIGQIGSGRRNFENCLELVPESERAALWRGIDRETSFGLFRHLVREWAISGKVFDQGVLESFEFKLVDFPEKSFEMQATEVTQLQYALVMGRNPSKFVQGDGMANLRLGGRSVRIHPNRPVEMVSWEEAQEFIERLNQLQSDYTYRLPTNEEWEFAMRGGSEQSDMRYWFGDREEDVVDYAWWGRNSGGHTHQVAGLPANPFGLHDMNGNVWEWVQNGNGSERVLRGGGWECRQVSLLCSLGRATAYQDTRSSTVGFRLARERRSP